MDLVTPIIAGAAGALLKQLTDKGVDWLIQLVGSHSLTVQQQAQRNAQNFLVRLARRVEILEAELPAARKSLFEEALGHPGSSLLMQKALVSAAATENDDRHEILSELIAQRLTAEADDMIALVGSAACDVVNALSSLHIRLLGVMTRLFQIRPLNPPIIGEQSTYDEALLHWWEALNPLSEGLDNIAPIDLQHLQGLSCISISMMERDLSKIIASPLPSSKLNPAMEKFKDLPWWPRFKHLWDIGIKSSALTSIGVLIGTLFHDSTLKSRTDIKWNNI